MQYIARARQCILRGDKYHLDSVTSWQQEAASNEFKQGCQGKVKMSTIIKNLKYS